MQPVPGGLKPGPYVLFTVTDTGAGISGEIRSKIFEPYFSTKFTGRGLGLATVHGIVNSHEGAIFVEGKPGEGAEVTGHGAVVLRERCGSCGQATDRPL